MSPTTLVERHHDLFQHEVLVATLLNLLEPLIDSTARTYSTDPDL